MIKPRIYLAGPDDNHPAFNAEAARLRAIGFHVENQAENQRQVDWQHTMRVFITRMMTCDAVALLPGWQLSRSALIVNGLAVSLGIKARPCAEYQKPTAKPDCWKCSGTGFWPEDGDECDCTQVTA